MPINDLVLPFRVVLLAAGLLLVAAPVGAQQTPGSLSGSVRDAAGLPIENALVVLDPATSRRVLRSDTAGRFRFDRVGTGQHELAIVFVGFQTDVRTLRVTDQGLDVDIVLQRSRTVIDTMRVEARRTGVFGTVIAKDGFLPLGGAEVQVIGAGPSARTGVDGRFAFGSVSQGAWVVHVKRSGYQGRMLSVVVPRDSAIELALTLDAVVGDSEKRFAMLFAEFDQRRRYMVSTNAALVPRQELAARGRQSLFDALRYSRTYLLKGLVLDEDACIYVNGVFRQAASARDFGVEEIEAVEVYGTGADLTATVTARHGTAASRLPRNALCGASSGSRALSTAVPLDRRMMSRAGPRANPARVEAIVIWLKR